MKKPMGAQWRFALATIVSIVLLIGVANVITQPVAMPTHTYHADFTDASGLHEKADVRVRGVRVGKVEGLRLKRSGGRSLAEVTITLDSRFNIVPESRLAIKFQALTGLRYVDVTGATEGSSDVERITTIPANMTQPSYDITILFNGLQPVLATLSPDQINTFTDNVSQFLAGDGDGLGPMLESIHTLTALVTDRSQVITTIIQNLSVLAEGVRGRSDSLIEMLKLVKQPIDSGLTVLDEFRKSQIYGKEFLDAAMHLFNSAGLNADINIETAFDTAFTNVYEAIDWMKHMPVIWENIQPPPVKGEPAPCSLGRAELPLPMDVLLNGRKVVLCNQ